MAPHPNMAPELAAALGGAGDLDIGTLSFADLPGLRAQAEAAVAAVRAPNPRVDIEDRIVERPEGGPDLRLRVYRPVGRTDPMPCLYWIHGGGMILGSPDIDDSLAVRAVERADCAVVSVDYRLAPEHPHPAPVADCYAGFRWTAANAEALAIDPGRIAVGGSSAGGGLAAAVALMARDSGGPAPIFQLLLYPMLDDRNTTPSSRAFTDGPTWSRRASIFAWTALLGDAVGTEDVSPYAAPARAADLAGLPRAFVSVGELEPFRDECIDYARRLVQAGVSTEFHLYPGAFHGFDVLAPDAEISRRAVDDHHAALRRALHA
ncbi:acetyl esterase/lipase [Murinocardiopsis flavida]|uniref:Acetyl esterase/lipase n=1 Tax=Murinocardiopsis flavida TaxID=645275 RepID=A0A2P8DFL0_9ACTN|nr:alpha/beta hydrolase [Murinocardiopsis flavida]PSK96008.1 acetyl esterase/lipase [Murinocardiopsis flavida]